MNDFWKRHQNKVFVVIVVVLSALLISARYGLDEQDHASHALLRGLSSFFIGFMLIEDLLKFPGAPSYPRFKKLFGWSLVFGTAITSLYGVQASMDLKAIGSDVKTLRAETCHLIYQGAIIDLSSTQSSKSFGSVEVQDGLSQAAGKYQACMKVDEVAK